MTEFVIVIAAAAIGLAAPSSPLPSAAEAALVPLNAPIVGFRTYPDEGACERATAGLVAPAGRRLVCLPIEAPLGGPAHPY